MLQLENPNALAKSSGAQSDAGSLSTVMNDPGSREPKKKAFQLTDPLLIAAA